MDEYTAIHLETGIKIKYRKIIIPEHEQKQFITGTLYSMVKVPQQEIRLSDCGQLLQQIDNVLYIFTPTGKLRLECNTSQQ